ncbi:hypothetical protein P4E94_15365 [Pontiellaceae bacterium B12219]|nr:hypothetical protein [Pontiellaceae bacterium B12219]
MRVMKVFKNILLTIALLLVAMPCTHAFGHQHASAGSEYTEQISAVHTCACHSCDEKTICTEPLESPQDLTLSAAPAVFKTAARPLFVLNQCRPEFRPAFLSVPGILAGLKTVQLLI